MYTNKINMLHFFIVYDTMNSCKNNVENRGKIMEEYDVICRNKQLKCTNERSCINLSSTQLVVFSLDKEEYAVNISYTQEIVRIPELTKLPNVPEFVQGIINLRGKIIPIFDLKKRFGIIEQSERGSDSRLLILELDGMKAGIVVDDVSEVMRVEEESVQKLGNEVVGISRNSIDGIVIVNQRVIIVLNALKLRDEMCKYNFGKEKEL